jgi:hypothetical protein
MLPGTTYVSARSVVVDAVVEAPEGQAEGQVVQVERLVRRQLPLELRVDEAPVREELPGLLPGPALRLRVFGRDARLGVGADAEVEVPSGIEKIGVRPPDEREPSRQPERHPSEVHSSDVVER